MAQQSENMDTGTALVVGAGVAGIRSALDLAESGYRVLLTDASPAIGGILAKLDYQFPDDHCGMCKMLPLVGREHATEHCMRRSLFHDRIEILPFTEVTALEGEPGSYEVTLRQHPRYVDPDACIGTGRCAEVCPIEVPDEFNQGLTHRKAIFQPVPHNLANNWVVDMQACDRCGKCLEVCPTDAIHLDAEPTERQEAVDALIFAAGSGLYDPANLPAYASSPNVVTSLEFERLLSGTGTYEGTIARPSDGKAAKRIAWLQCVGSRNKAEGKDFCSSICCMFALKEAVLAHEKGGEGVETSILYMDLRAFGKDFYRYQRSAEQDHGVKLRRCRNHEVIPEESGDITLRFWDDAAEAFTTETFDLVVLSVGQAPHTAHTKLAELLGIETTPTGFFPVDGVDRVQGPRDGVFLCGSFSGLTDISEALTSGSAAASEASRWMHERGKAFVPAPAPPPERDVAREAARVGVLLCRCNAGALPEGVDLEAMRDAVAAHPGVTDVRIIEGLCHDDGLERLRQQLADADYNRVLLGACFPYVHKRLLHDTARAAGFNPALTDVADLRTLIQTAAREDATAELPRRAARALGAAVERLKASDVLQAVESEMVAVGLVVGGGVAGMRAALSLADRGLDVHLVEKGERLGGLARELHYTVDGLDPQALVRDLAERVATHDRVTVHLNSRITDHQGSLGRFRSRVTRENGKDQSTVVWHGVTIVATGAERAQTTLHQHGESEQVLTQHELEERLATGTLDPAQLGRVFMIQCVGSREPGAHEYCSRICCASALKNAARIKEANPDVRIVVLYRDVMAYGALEPYYTRAREQGVLFVPYSPERPPQVTLDEGAPTLQFYDPVLLDEVKMKADLVALSTGFEAASVHQNLAETLDLPLNADGFFQEADYKWRPVDFLKAGMYVAGAAHSPRNIAESIAMAEAAAQRAFTHLSQPTVTSARVVSVVHDAICSRCETCIRICPFEARSLDPEDHRILVDAAACQACGLCAVACPNSAAELPGHSERQTMAVLDAVLSDTAATP